MENTSGYTPKPKTPRVVHLVGENSPARRITKCGQTRVARVWPGEPKDVSLIVDKFCTRCFKRWTIDQAPTLI